MSENAIYLVVAAFVLFAAEILLPGVFAAIIAIGLLMLASGIVVAEYGIASGASFFLLALLVSVIFICIEIFLLRRRSIARWIVMDKTSTGVSNIEKPACEPGTTGMTVSRLTPSGRVTIGDVIYDAVSDSGQILENQPVSVVRKDAFAIVVRPVDAE